MTSFTWSAADAFLFDIDGTLLNSRDGVHYWAFHNAVRRYFLISSKIDDVPVHGNTDIGIIRAVLTREGVPEQEVTDRLPLIVEHMCAEVAQNKNGLRPELCPSVMDLVRSLHSAGKLLGVVSGNLERIGWLKLEAAGLRPYFSFGCFSDRREKREEIFRAGIEEARRRLGTGAAVHFVGDTPSDIAAARQVGAPIIALATGIFPHHELMRHGPDACFSCCTELLAAT
ncbi:MAG TPA: HAD family hydrolase [Terriglobales bacterium]|nr:HAD family hydrolase [Terriglobales bacterium]